MVMIALNSIHTITLTNFFRFGLFLSHNHTNITSLTPNPTKKKLTHPPTLPWVFRSRPCILRCKQSEASNRDELSAYASGGQGPPLWCQVPPLANFFPSQALKTEKSGVGSQIDRDIQGWVTAHPCLPPALPPSNDATPQTSSSS